MKRIAIIASRSDAASARRLASALKAALAERGPAPPTVTIWNRHAQSDAMSFEGDLSDVTRIDRVVVLATPNSAKSLRVNGEIRRFLSCHEHADFVVALWRGAPFASGGKAECVPEALRDDAGGPSTLEMVDLRPNGRHVAERIDALIAAVTSQRHEGDAAFLHSDASRRDRSRHPPISADRPGRRSQRPSPRRWAASAVVAVGIVSGMFVFWRQQASSPYLAADPAGAVLAQALRVAEDNAPTREYLSAALDGALQEVDATPPGALSSVALKARAEALHGLGRRALNIGMNQRSGRAFRAAYAATEAAMTRAPDDPPTVHVHALSAFYVGNHAWRTAQLDVHGRFHQEFFDLAERLTQLEPGNPLWTAELAHAHVNLGVHAQERHRLDEAIAYFETAIDRLEPLTAEGHVRPKDLGNALGFYATTLDSLGAFDRAVAARWRQQALYRRALAEKPGSRLYARSLTKSNLELAGLLLQRGDANSARAALEEAERLITPLVEFDPDNRRYLRLHVAVGFERAALAIAEGRLPTARLLLNAAGRMRDSLVAAGGEDDRLISTAQYAILSARLALMIGAPHEARFEAFRAATATEAAVKENGWERARLGAAEAHFILGEAQIAAGFVAEADDAFRRAMAYLAESRGSAMEIAALQARIEWRLGAQQVAVTQAQSLRARGYREPVFERFWTEVEADVAQLGAGR